MSNETAPADSIARWGIPDWRDISAYPRVHTEMSNRQWWWEFTRRRQDYRDLWTAATPPPSEKETWRDPRTDHIHFRHAVDMVAVQRLRTKFRLSRLIDPATRLDDATIVLLMYPIDNAMVVEPRSSALAMVGQGHDAAKLGAEYLGREEVETDAGLVRYVFNLSKPLQPQIAAARASLKQAQNEIYGAKNTSKPHRSAWPVALRALDAKAANATLSQMVELFWPGYNRAPNSAKHEKRADEAYRTGCRLRDNFPL